MIDGKVGIYAQFPGRGLVLFDTVIEDNWSEFTAYIDNMGQKKYLYTLFKDHPDAGEALESEKVAHARTQNKIDDIVGQYKVQRGLNSIVLDAGIVAAAKRSKRLPEGPALGGFGSRKESKDCVLNILALSSPKLLDHTPKFTLGLCPCVCVCLLSCLFVCFVCLFVWLGIKTNYQAGT